MFFYMQIILYECENFQGRKTELNAECRNICEKGVDRVRSIKVECGP